MGLTGCHHLVDFHAWDPSPVHVVVTCQRARMTREGLLQIYFPFILNQNKYFIYNVTIFFQMVPYCLSDLNGKDKKTPRL